MKNDLKGLLFVAALAAGAGLCLLGGGFTAVGIALITVTVILGMSD